MPDEPDDFEIERIGDTIVFRFRRTSILDEQSTGWFGENVFRAADATPQPRIVVDFRNVIFISSAGLGKLLTLHRKVQAAGGWLKVVNLSPDVADVFRITKLDQIFRVGDEGDDGGAGVPARVRPPTPSGGAAAALPHPTPPEPD